MEKNVFSINRHSGMEITMKEVAAAIQNTEGGLAKIIRTDLPPKAAYRIGRLVDGLSKAYHMYSQQRAVMFQKYGEPVFEVKEDGTSEDTGRLRVKDEHIAEFEAEMDALGATKVSLWYAPIPIEDLGDIKLSVVDSMALLPFFLWPGEQTPDGDA